MLNEHIPGDGAGWTIVDVFGGSGLLSHTAKTLKPKARVIYNDFDGYAERLKHIDDINRLRGQIAALLADTPKDKRLDNPTKARVIALIEAFDGYKDLNCLASWLLFSGKQVGTLEKLYKLEFFHSVRQTDYPTAEGYLDGVEVVNESFHKLLPRFTGQPNTLLLLDPPYLCTKQESYKQDTFFDLIDFLRLIHLTRPPYIFFSSTKSEFLRFLDWIAESKADNWRSFDGSQKISLDSQLNYHVMYQDNMVFKF